jgi:hypothetical protein
MNKLNIQLKKIEHFVKYPSMIPYIGQDYELDLHKKLLLIGESNYLPEESEIHLDDKKWYKSSEDDLTDEEIEWINCRGLLECNWDSPGHFIYRELNRSLQEVLPISTVDNKTRAISHCAFMNCFQRPSTTGNSIKNLCTRMDIDESNKTKSSVIEIIKPDIVIFVSKLSWDLVGKNYKDNRFDFVCHPGTGGRYWHNNKYPHGKRKFIQILKKRFIFHFNKTTLIHKEESHEK